MYLEGCSLESEGTRVRYRGEGLEVRVKVEGCMVQDIGCKDM